MDAHPNFAYSTVAVAPSPAASGTTLTVAAGTGALFSQFPFDATVWPLNAQPTTANAEIVRITGRSGDVLTIQRQAEGTSARSILVGDQIAVVASEKVFTDIEDAIPSIAASNTTYSTGTISITGVGGGVTVSSNTGQRVDISVAAPVAQSVQPETQTFVGGISASDALYTSGTVRLTGVGGGVTVSSNTGQRVDISVAAPVAQTVQTQNAVDVTLAGNTAGALALVSSGTMTLAGGNNVTLSQAGNAVTISAAAGGAATAISGLANSQTTYTSGTVNLSVVAGNLTIRSTTGQAFQFSASQSVQAETQTFLGAVAASNTTYTSGTVTITGVGGGITVSSNTGQRIDLSVAAQTTQTQGILSAGVSTGGNTAGNTTVNTGSRLVLAGAGAVSLSQATAAGASTISISVSTQTVQTQGILSAGVSTGGNTAGNTQVSTGSRLVIVGSNGITASQGTAAGATTITLSGVTQSVQTQNMVAVTLSGNTSGAQALISSGTLTLAGGNNITVSQAGNAVTISGANVGGAQTGISGLANSQTTYTSGTVSLSELGAITIRSTTGNQFQLSVNAQSVQPETQTFMAGIQNSQTTYTSGTVNLSVVAGNLTIRSTTGQAFQFSMSQTVQAETQTAISGLANSQTTYTSGTVSLSELGAVTIRSTTGNQFQISVNSQTAQTQSLIQALYDGANSVTTGTVRLTNANGVSFSLNGQTLSASVNDNVTMYANSNTTQSTSGTVAKSAMSFAGAGIASVGVTGGSVLISVPAGGGAGDGGVFGGVSTMGNTAGATGTVSTGNFVLVGTGPVSLSQATGAAGSAATITIDAPATSSLSGSGDIRISTNGSTISIGDKNPMYDWQNFPAGDGQLMTLVAGISKTPFYWQDHIDGYLTAKSLAFKGSMVTANTLLSMSVHLGVYTVVNSTSAALLGSVSEAYVVSSATSASLSGVRNFMMTGIGTHTALSTISAGEYMFGMMFSAGATASMNMSLFGASTANGPLGGIYPGTNNVSAGTSQGIQALRGRGSTTVNAMPANVVASELINQGSGASMQLHPWIYIRS